MSTANLRFPYCPDWCEGGHDSRDEEIGEVGHWSADLTPEGSAATVQVARYDDIDESGLTRGPIYGGLLVRERGITEEYGGSSAADLGSSSEIRAIAAALVAVAELMEKAGATA